MVAAADRMDVPSIMSKSGLFVAFRNALNKEMTLSASKGIKVKGNHHRPPTDTEHHNVIRSPGMDITKTARSHAARLVYGLSVDGGLRSVKEKYNTLCTDLTFDEVMVNGHWRSKLTWTPNTNTKTNDSGLDVIKIDETPSVTFCPRRDDRRCKSLRSSPCMGLNARTLSAF